MTRCRIATLIHTKGGLCNLHLVLMILRKLASLVHGPKVHTHTWTNFLGEPFSSRTLLVMDVVDL